MQWFEQQILLGFVLYISYFDFKTQTLPILTITSVLLSIYCVVKIGLSRHVNRFKQTYSESSLPNPTVSLAIPARNEGQSLTNTLKSAVTSTYEKLEVLVLDDCSHDRTPEIIRAYANDGVRFIEGQPLQEDWLGRNFALHQLSVAANGEIFIFADVDVHFSEETISNIVATMQNNNVDLVSVHPGFRNTWQLSSLFNTLRTYWKSLLFATPIHGQCIAVKKDALLDVGGFESFKDSFYFEVKLLESIQNSLTITNGNRIGLSVYKSFKARVEKDMRGLFPFLNKNYTAACLFSCGALLAVGLPMVFLLSDAWLLATLVLATYGASAFIIHFSELGLFSGLLAAALFPFKVVFEVVLLAISAALYSNQYVFWKDRNICLPMYEVTPKLPKV